MHLKSSNLKSMKLYKPTATNNRFEGDGIKASCYGKLAVRACRGTYNQLGYKSPVN